MAHSKCSILIVEDDSHISRVIHSHLEKAFPDVRVDIAGSAAKARQICEKFAPTFVIWDGAPNERGTKEEYSQCVPDDLWNRVIPISIDESLQVEAKNRGSHPPIPKKSDAINTWSESVVEYLRPLIGRNSKKKH